MKTTVYNIGVICLMVFGTTLVAGRSFESYDNESGSNCEQCHSVLTMIQNNREDEISLEQLEVENSLCDSLCMNVRDTLTVFGARGKAMEAECNQCIAIISKVNGLYKTTKNIDTAMTQACTAWELPCRAFIAAQKNKIRNYVGDINNPRSVCGHLAKC